MVPRTAGLLVHLLFTLATRPPPPLLRLWYLPCRNQRHRQHSNTGTPNTPGTPSTSSTPAPPTWVPLAPPIPAPPAPTELPTTGISTPYSSRSSNSGGNIVKIVAVRKP